MPFPKPQYSHILLVFPGYFSPSLTADKPPVWSRNCPHFSTTTSGRLLTLLWFCSPLSCSHSLSAGRSTSGKLPTASVQLQPVVLDPLPSALCICSPIIVLTSSVLPAVETALQHHRVILQRLLPFLTLQLYCTLDTYLAALTKLLQVLEMGFYN